MREAACRGLPEEYFFEPEPEEFNDTPAFSKETHRRFAQGRKVCNSCPVRPQCLDENIRMEFGLYGGLSVRQREQLMRDLGMTEQSRKTANHSLTPASVQVVRELLAEGLSYTHIHTQTGVSRASISRIANNPDFGLKPMPSAKPETDRRVRSKSGTFAEVPTQSWAEPKYKEIRDLLHAGETANQIARKTDASVTKVRRVQIAMEQAGVL
jgi:uncharacterized protein YerC